MKNYFILPAILCITFASLSFAQLDSVYYQGPSQGSQPNGAIQNTNNFLDAPEIIQGGEMRVVPPVNTDIVGEPMYMDYDASQLPDYVYVEDANAIAKDNPSLNGGSALLNSFLGFNATNAFPPDPTMAVGPNHIIAMVNGFPSYFRIFDKQGNVIKTINVAAWFAPVSPDEYGDPQIIYDHFAHRWILLVMQYNSGNQTAANLVSYSDDDDPIGTWYVYRFDTKKHGTIQSTTWGDYPQIGYDDEAFYIATRVFGFASGFFGMKIRVIKKSELYNANGGPVTWWDFWDIAKPNTPSQKLDAIHPSFSYTAGQTGYFFFASRTGGNFYVLYKVLKSCFKYSPASGEGDTCSILL